jgi:ubiquinone/menaquinone biosynthesis C-methylase UbiE
MKAEPTQRFSSRVEDYVKYRPSYPKEIVDLLRQECGLTPSAIIADMGSGTGIFTELFLKNGNIVYGVEPNAKMREAGEKFLESYPNFRSVDGKSESTTLPDQSVDFVTAAQAFHWFDREKARKEFARILRPKGWTVLIWNDRRFSTPFLTDFESFLLEYGTDYTAVRKQVDEQNIQQFFSPQLVQQKSLTNQQICDWEGLLGRVQSASYMPSPEDSKFLAMTQALRRIYEKHATSGTVTLEYDTRVYYGRLSATS